MADPRENPVQDRKNPLSPLMRALTNNKSGDKINFCPFGCEVDDLDDHGYCRHLVGFSNDKKTFEPMVEDHTGRKIVRVPMKREGQGKKAKMVPDMENMPVVQKTDKLVQITVSYRVYRDVDVEPAPILKESRQVAKSTP